MEHIAVHNVTVNMPATASWEKLRDLSLAHNYVPGIARCKITTDKKEGVGASRRVSGKQGALDETVIEWNDGKGFKLKLHNGDKPAFPFAAAEFTYRIDPLDDTKSKLTTTLVYDLRWGFLGQLLGKLFMYNMIRSNICTVAMSMQHYYNTGKPTTPEDLARIKAA